MKLRKKKQLVLTITKSETSGAATMLDEDSTLSCQLAQLEGK